MDEVKLPKRPVLTIDELAQALAVTRNHIRELIRTGRIKTIEIGTGTKKKKFRILTSSVREQFPGLFENAVDESETIPMKGG